MRKRAFVFTTCGVMALAGAAPSYASSNYHSFVSAFGSGTACTLNAPCFALSDALAATVDGGEISCLDAQTEFAVHGTIAQSVTIDCAGVPATAFNLVISGPGIVVTLRNLTVSRLGFPLSTNGIDFQNGAALFVENCVIEGWNNISDGIGIRFAPPSGTAKLQITDSVIKNNGTSSEGGGIYIELGSGRAANVAITRTQVQNNRVGIFANAGTIHAVVRDSVVSGNATWGIGALGANTTLLIDNTTITGNNNGLVAENGATMLVSHSNIMGNGTGLYRSGGGTLVSYKNNNLIRNTTDGTFSSTLVQQ
jgi:hypothetical protein